MKYNVVVSDFDGTLLRSDGTISEETKNTIREFQSRGGQFLISTGRMPSSILPWMEKLGLHGDVMCCQGSVLCRSETGELLYSEGIETDMAATILQALEKDDLSAAVFLDGESYIAKKTPFTEMYDEACGAPSKVTAQPLSVFMKSSGKKANKIITVQDGPDTERLRKKFFGRFSGVEVNISEKYLLEFASAAYNKGAALSKLRERLPEGSRIITLGDSLIDVSLVKNGDLGVAVGNARQEVKDAADLVTIANDDDAVAYIIRNYCLNDGEPGAK